VGASGDALVGERERERERERKREKERERERERLSAFLLSVETRVARAQLRERKTGRP
jgi:hypothetical protein